MSRRHFLNITISPKSVNPICGSSGFIIDVSQGQDGKLVKGGIIQNLMAVDSVLGVYSTGKNMAEARKNFVKAL